MMLRLSKLRATTEQWATAYPWHYGPAIPSTGPALGVDVLAGGAPFGLDLFEAVRVKVAQNPNAIVVGSPANGKSAVVKQMVWWMVGAFGLRFVATDVKGEYSALADALGVPVLDLHPGGSVKVNPLDLPTGRLEFCQALAAICLDRGLLPVERAALSAAMRVLPDRPLIADLVGVLREMPAGVCDELVMPRHAALDQTQGLRFGFGELLAGVEAGMFDGHTNVDLAGSRSGFVVDVSQCGADDRLLRLAMLAGMRATNQLISGSPGQTLVVNDESWRLAGNIDTVHWMRDCFKLGRQRGQGSILVLHRFSELGHQADGAVGEIASKLVSDADTHIMFRHGDHADATDAVTRLGLPDAAVELLARLPPYRCLVHVRGRFALVDVALSARMRTISDTNAAMRQPAHEDS